MAKYQQYAEYKDSEVEWLGEIPKSWKILTFKWLANEGKAFASGPFGSSIGSQYYRDEGVPVIRGNNLNLDAKKPKFIDSGYVYLDEKKADELSNAEVISGDLVFTARGTVGQIGLIPDHTQILWKRAILSANQLRFRNFNNSTDSNYLWYLFSSWFVRTQIYLNSDSVAQPNLNLGSLKNLKLTIPEYFEQTQIANFLDHETAKIDTLIEKQQTLIQLLKEKRQAVISHAVTKGLNPDAPMKDSGVEWVDIIPEHWKSSRLGYWANVGNGATPSRENMNFWKDGSVPWLNSSKINDVIVKEAEQFITPLAKIKTSVQPIRENDLLIAITGEGQTRGRVAISKLEATINQHLASIRITDNNEINYEYLYFWLDSNYERIRFESSGAGSTKGAITCGDIASYPVLIPPFDEQKKIVKHLKSRNILFDSLSSKAQQAIQLMQERRTALISAAVTGKIDVRGWVAPDVDNLK